MPDIAAALVDAHHQLTDWRNQMTALAAFPQVAGGWDRWDVTVEELLHALSPYAKQAVLAGSATDFPGTRDRHRRHPHLRESPVDHRRTR